MIRRQWLRGWPRRTATYAVLTVALVSLSLSGCSEAGGTTEPVVEGACLEVSADLLAQIAVGTEAGMTFEASDGAAVQARKDVYVVAVRFQGGSEKPEVGVWTATALEGTAAPMLVADEVASTFTTWSSVEEFPQFGVELDSPLVAAARDCLDE